MGTVNTYNPSDVYLIICGHQCTGWQDITVERSTPAFKHIKGIRGKHTRVRDVDSSAIITITVMQTSETNDILSEVHRQDIENGTGRLELSLIDRSGSTLISSIEAYITSYPSKTFSDTIEFIPWTIQCQSTESFVIGGNSQPNAPLLGEALKRLGIN